MALDGVSKHPEKGRETQYRDVMAPEGAFARTNGHDIVISWPDRGLEASKAGSGNAIS